MEKHKKKIKELVTEFETTASTERKTNIHVELFNIKKEYPVHGIRQINAYIENVRDKVRHDLASKNKGKGSERRKK